MAYAATPVAKNAVCLYRQPMKVFCCNLLVLLVLGGCSEKQTHSADSAPTQTQPAVTIAEPNGQTSSETAGSVEEPVRGVWAGQVKIDAHAGVATLNYVGPESGDFVPMRFSTSSEVGAKILAECADDDLCEVEGTIEFLSEPPPENASAVGRIVKVDRVKKLPPDTQ